jgi:hypothetical protein
LVTKPLCGWTNIFAVTRRSWTTGRSSSLRGRSPKMMSRHSKPHERPFSTIYKPKAREPVPWLTGWRTHELAAQPGDATMPGVSGDDRTMSFQARVCVNPRVFLKGKVSSGTSVALAGSNSDSPDRDGLEYALAYKDAKFKRRPSRKSLGPSNSTPEAHP